MQTPQDLYAGPYCEVTAVTTAPKSQVCMFVNLSEAIVRASEAFFQSIMNPSVHTKHSGYVTSLQEV